MRIITYILTSRYVQSSSTTTCSNAYLDILSWGKFFKDACTLVCCTTFNIIFSRRVAFHQSLATPGRTARWFCCGCGLLTCALPESRFDFVLCVFLGMAVKLARAVGASTIPTTKDVCKHYPKNLSPCSLEKCTSGLHFWGGAEYAQYTGHDPGVR